MQAALLWRGDRLSHHAYDGHETISDILRGMDSLPRWVTTSISREACAAENGILRRDAEHFTRFAVYLENTISDAGGGQDALP